jgi:hypothetical protein
VQRLADQRDAPVRPRRVRRETEHEAAHEFRAGARLAGAAPAKRKPGGPFLAAFREQRRQLVRLDEQTPVAKKIRALVRTEVEE